jgi:hypothetical protein
MTGPPRLSRNTQRTRAADPPPGYGEGQSPVESSSAEACLNGCLFGSADGSFDGSSSTAGARSGQKGHPQQPGGFQKPTRNPGGITAPVRLGSRELTGCGRHIDSRTEADAEATRIRGEILAGTFVPVAKRGQSLSSAAITEDDIELFLADLRAQHRAASTRNKYVQLCKAMFRWATRKGYITRNPIAVSESIHREKMAKRNRRLLPDEEQQLLRHGPPHLQRLIIAALETGCRSGEFLSLTWGQVGPPELTLEADQTKDEEQRILPISSRLAAVLEMVRTDPEGRMCRVSRPAPGDQSALPRSAA